MSNDLEVIVIWNLEVIFIHIYALFQIKKSICMHPLFTNVQEALKIDTINEMNTTMKPKVHHLVKYICSGFFFFFLTIISLYY